LKVYNLKCPNCGATLATDVKNRRARCEYCGNEFMISDETENTGKDTGINDSKAGQPPEKGPASDKIPVRSRKKSHSRDLLIVFVFVIAGLMLSLAFDKENPGDIVPKTDLHRFFMEVRTSSTPRDVESLAQKHKLHFFRTEKAVNSGAADTVYYKFAKTNETALDRQGAHGETIEMEFDISNNNAFKWAAYTDPEHIVSRAVLFRTGPYLSLSLNAAVQKEAEGYYYYNNSLRSTADGKNTHPPYLKCTDAVEALKRIYTYKK